MHAKQQQQQTPNRQCSVRWLNAWMRQEDSSMSREKSASPSVSIMDSKMDHLSWCVLRAGRGLSKSPQSVFPTAKELTQQLLKGENHSIKKCICYSPCLAEFSTFLLKIVNSPLNTLNKQIDKYVLNRSGPLTISKWFHFDFVSLWALLLHQKELQYS